MPLCAKKISDEALTTSRSAATVEFSFQVVIINDESIRLLTRQSQEEVGTVEACTVRGFRLGDVPTFIPVYHCPNAFVNGNLMRCTGPNGTQTL
jgi:hypothetical protein